MNRDEHITRVKQRALEYVQSGDYTNAIASMVSDLGKHHATENHPARQLCIMLLLTGHLNTYEEVTSFINGIN